MGVEYDDDSLGKRIGKCFLSGIFAGLFGVVVAEVVANSLIEISVTPIFSVVWGFIYNLYFKHTPCIIHYFV